MGKNRRAGGATPMSESSRGSLCPYCGKKSYSSRKYAKEANRRLYPNEKLSAYKCQKAPEFADTSKFWHIGHLAPQVVNGKRARAEIHGSEPVQLARQAPRKPFPASLRATIIEKPKESAADNDETDKE